MASDIVHFCLGALCPFTKRLQAQKKCHIFIQFKRRLVMSIAPSLVHSNKKGGTVHMFVGDSNPRYYACMGTSCVYCNDMDTAKAHLQYWAKDRDLEAS